MATDSITLTLWTSEDPLGRVVGMLPSPILVEMFLVSGIEFITGEREEGEG